MKYIKELIDIITAATDILHVDPNNMAAKMIRNLAGQELVDDQYPFTDVNGGLCIEVGQASFILDNVNPGNVESNGAVVAQLKRENADLKGRINALGSALSAFLTPSAAPEQSAPVEIDEEPTPVEPVTAQTYTPEEEGPATKAHTPATIQEPAISDVITKPEVRRPAPESDDTIPLNMLNNTSNGDTSSRHDGYDTSIKEDDLALSVHEITIKDARGLTSKVTVIISPLSMEEGESNIIAWIGNDIKSETKVSGQRKSVLLQLGNVPIIASGSVHNGKFTGKVSTTSNMAMAGVTITSVDTQTNGNGHILIEDDEGNLTIHAVPLSKNNSASGNAEFFYAIMGEDVSVITGDNITGKSSIPFTHEGTAYSLKLAWRNGTLYSMVSK